MGTTIFESSIATGLLQPLSRLILRAVGWRKEGALGDMRQVVIGAHHTSNWDFVLVLLFAFDFGFPMHWMGKDSLFVWPFGALFKWLGGIPVDRSRSRNAVDAAVQELENGNIRFLVIAPEGTRKKAARWKTGFYHIATGAKMPIALGFLDYKRQVGGFGPALVPTGEIESDMARIREFYDGVSARFPEKVTRA